MVVTTPVPVHVGATEQPSCPACGRTDIPSPLVFEASRHSEGHVVGLSCCPECRVYFTRPRLVNHNKATRDVRLEYLVTKYGNESRSGNFHKNGNYEYYLELAEQRLARSGRSEPFTLLDIGSHCGFFLRFAKERGWKVEGIEPSDVCVQFARQMNGIESIQQGYFDDQFDSRGGFDLIAMLDVLEHIPDPVPLLQLARASLVRGGVVLCKVPHIRFYLTWRPAVTALGALGLLPRFPTSQDPPAQERRDSSIPGFFDLFEHVVHYDRNGVSTIFGKAGFESTEILPAPPTNPTGHPLNFPRTFVYRIARLLHRMRIKPNSLTHGLVILGRKTD